MRFFFSDTGFVSSLATLGPYDEDFMLGVLGARMPDDYSIPLDEMEVLLEDMSSVASMDLSLAVSAGLFSNIFGRETLKMESVGMFGVDNSKPP